jgi:hypothetical protein
MAEDNRERMTQALDTMLLELQVPRQIVSPILRKLLQVRLFVFVFDCQHLLFTHFALQLPSSLQRNLQQQNLDGILIFSFLSWIIIVIVSHEGPSRILRYLESPG